MIYISSSVLQKKLEKESFDLLGETAGEPLNLTVPKIKDFLNRLRFIHRQTDFVYAEESMEQTSLQLYIEGTYNYWYLRTPELWEDTPLAPRVPTPLLEVGAQTQLGQLVYY